ncbi:MAG: hypothetical protein HYX27_01090 [Acidobacteria bacterium]|nr:hypothetical protein [Acidobacteriota bacterium]
MPELTFSCTIKSESAISAACKIDDDLIPLQRNGDTFGGRKKIRAGATARVQIGVVGLQGTVWKADVSIACPASSVSLLSKDGVVPSSGRSRIDRQVDIPDNPCGD